MNEAVKLALSALFLEVRAKRSITCVNSRELFLDLCSKEQKEAAICCLAPLWAPDQDESTNHTLSATGLELDITMGSCAESDGFGLPHEAIGPRFWSGTSRVEARR